jgi:hypothetical protein
LHYNPQHALAGQLEWDAEHSPESVGLSHNVMAQTTKRGEHTVVEAITRVLGVDLVADPATTRGLYEEVDPTTAVPEALTVAQLRERRPDLVTAIVAETRTTQPPQSREQRQVERLLAGDGTLESFVRAVTRK